DEGGSRRTEPRPNPGLQRLQADREHDGPADLHEEGLDDPIGEPGEEEERAVEDDGREAPDLALVGHRYFIPSRSSTSPWSYSSRRMMPSRGYSRSKMT